MQTNTQHTHYSVIPTLICLILSQPVEGLRQEHGDLPGLHLKTLPDSRKKLGVDMFGIVK